MNLRTRLFLKKLIGKKSAHDPIIYGKHGEAIFVHINKTAGTSILSALQIEEKHHFTALQTIAMVGYPAWQRAFKFSFVRNPWAKIVSHYKYRVKTNQTGLGDGHLDFNAWVNKTIGPDRDSNYYDNPRMFQPQCDWLKDEDGTIWMNYIGRFENLEEDFSEIAGFIGISKKLPHLNPTQKTDYRAYYNDATAEMVAQWCAEDIQRFRYQF